MRSFFVEALGTFFLVLVYGFTGNAIAIGLILAALVYVTRHISGAHFNPAVSLAFWFNGTITASHFFGYIISQLAGAFFAAVMLLLLSGVVFYVEPPSDTNLYQQAIGEVLFVFLFVWVMLSFALTKTLRSNKLFGFAIGLTFTGILITGTPVSGGVFNPVFSMGPALVDLIKGGNSIIHSILYTIAPLTGGALAAVFFSWINE